MTPQDKIDGAEGLREAFRSGAYSFAASALSIADAALNPHAVTAADQAVALFAILMALDAAFELFGGMTALLARAESPNP